jgi:hypothetical protein
VQLPVAVFAFHCAGFPYSGWDHNKNDPFALACSYKGSIDIFNAFLLIDV